MIKEIIESLSKLLGPIASLAKDQRELKENALKSISTALDETYLYYRDLKNGNPSSSEREAMLAKLWSAAAIPMRHFDSQLSAMCEYKSEYWIDPEKYSDEQIDEMGIRIDNVRREYRKMLNPDIFN